VSIDKAPNVVIVRFANNKDKRFALKKEEYVIKLLQEHGVPAPKIYAFNEDSDGSYMILEKIRGNRVDEIWNSISKEEKMEISQKIGELLAKIHSIKLDKFGLIKEEGVIEEDIAFKFKQVGEPMVHSPFLRATFKKYNEDLSRLMSYHEISSEFISNYMKYLCDSRKILEYNEKPVLNHGDFFPGHIFVEKTDRGYQITGLIDFELACASAPSEDFIKLHRSGFFDDAELKEALKRGYGEINEKAVETLRTIRDVSFAQVLFESGDIKLGKEILGKVKEKIGKEKDEKLL